MTNTTITNAQALAVMVDVTVNGADLAESLAKVGASKDAFSEKATHMLAVALKPKTTSKAPSRAFRENAAMLDKVIDLINAKGERVSSVTIRDEFGLRSTQRAVSIARIGIENGTLVRVMVKSRTFYSTPELEELFKREDVENGENAA